MYDVHVISEYRMVSWCVVGVEGTVVSVSLTLALDSNWKPDIDQCPKS